MHLPGLHLLISVSSNLPVGRDERRIFSNTLDRMKHFQWYMTDIVYNDASVILGRSYYDGYPFTVSQNKRRVTSIDGAIYNKSTGQVKDELDEISLAESNPNKLSDKIKKFVLTTHGEFVVVIYNIEKQKCLIFNDALGRLPLYYCSSPNRFPDRIVMSREVKFVVPFLEKPSFDKLALAEYLLFRYPLGERTLCENIKRFPPAAMSVVDTVSGKFLLERLLLWNLDPKTENLDQLQEETRKMVKLFLGSSKNIAQTFSKEWAHVVLLSGGLDSRATLGGLVKVGANPVAYTFPSGETRIAGEIAQALRVRHQVVSSSFKATDEDYVKLTDGIGSSMLPHIISYLYGIRERVGYKAILHTGDGGFLLKPEDPPISGTRNFSDVEKLLQYIIETEHIFDLDEISSILAIDESAFKEHLNKLITAFPEKTMEGKLMHFLLFERSFKLYFPGEDKNRIILWSTTPFYSIPFLRASTNVSQSFKDHHILYKNLLSSLNTSLSRIRYYDRLIPLSVPGWLLKLYFLVFGWLKRHLHESGILSVNPIDLLGDKRSHKRAQERTDEIKKLTLRFLGQTGVDFLEQSRVREIVKKERNQLKLSVLASLVIYASLIRSSDYP